MSPVALFIAFIARRRAARRHSEAVRRYHVLLSQIADRRAQHRDWKHLMGDLFACRRVMLECEIVMRGKAGA